MDLTYKHDDEAAEFNTVTESGNITVSQGHEFIKQLLDPVSFISPAGNDEVKASPTSSPTRLPQRVT